MMVYHGTNQQNLSAIRKEGLHPRVISGVSNYSGSNAGKLASREDFVYLSNTRAVLYGLAANGRRPVLILEIPLDALDKNLCCPDEDSVVIRQLLEERVYETAEHDRRFDELHAQVKPQDHKAAWRSYFEEYGNIAYAGSLPFTTVVRYALIDELTLKNVMCSIFETHAPPSNRHVDLLDYQAETIGFMFDGTPITGIPDSDMWRLRSLRLEHGKVVRLRKHDLSDVSRRTQ